jgi:RNA polymerase primary sigma factor
MDALLLELYFNKIKAIPKLTRYEEKNFAILAKKGSSFARDKLIESCLKMVFKIAANYHFYVPEIPLADIVQEGNTALLEAFKNFDPNLGVRLITFAWKRIHGEIKDFTHLNISLIKLPLNSNQNKKPQKNNKTPYKKSAAPEEEKEEEKNCIIISRVNGPYEELNGDNKFYEIEDTRAYLDFENIFDEPLPDEINGALISILTEIEISVIEMRFGLNGYEPMSLKQIGNKLKLTKGRIWQIEEKALYKLKHSQICSSLKDYLY